jgi:hypothetical protein
VGYWIFVVLVLVGVTVALVLPRLRLRAAVAAPFPEEWVAIVERNIAVYKNLPMPLRLQLRNLIRQFLHQKHFSGAGGLEITDEIRVTIAAEACMLLVNRKTGVYPALRYIIVYPSAFVVDRVQGSAEGVVSEGRQGLLGESWSNGNFPFICHHESWVAASRPTSIPTTPQKMEAVMKRRTVLSS